ncbi:hypothetical protein JKY79_03330 [Candidatus Babeliales bacterium]|nr:hypothetical protein [Candidatus Babeliales bacterium]
MRFIIPFPSTWFRICTLYGLSLTSFITTFLLFHPFSYNELFHAVAHALIMPTFLFWLADTLLFGQEVEAFVVACMVAVYPGYFMSATLPFSLCGVSGALFLFLILAMNTFNFAWCELPRHVLETTLLYAPEMGFLTIQYDRLIDEIGYNKWYAKYRTAWLITIGLAWGGLMTVSPFFLLLGLTLFFLYGFVSSSYGSMIKKMMLILIPSLFVLMLLYFASPSTLSLENLQPRIHFDFFYKMPALIFTPTLFFMQIEHLQTWYTKIIFCSFVCMEIFFLIGFIGVLWLFTQRNLTIRHVVKLFPFLWAFLVAAFLEGNMSLVWVIYPCIAVIASVFWIEFLRPFLGTTSS